VRLADLPDDDPRVLQAEAEFKAKADAEARAEAERIRRAKAITDEWAGVNYCKAKRAAEAKAKAEAEAKAEALRASEDFTKRARLFFFSPFFAFSHCDVLFACENGEQSSGWTLQRGVFVRRRRPRLWQGVLGRLGGSRS
jgi:hypothetical protein